MWKTIEKDKNSQKKRQKWVKMVQNSAILPRHSYRQKTFKDDRGHAEKSLGMLFVPKKKHCGMQQARLGLNSVKIDVEIK